MVVAILRWRRQAPKRQTATCCANGSWRHKRACQPPGRSAPLQRGCLWKQAPTGLALAVVNGCALVQTVQLAGWLDAFLEIPIEPSPTLSAHDQRVSPNFHLSLSLSLSLSLRIHWQSDYSLIQAAPQLSATRSNEGRPLVVRRPARRTYTPLCLARLSVSLSVRPSVRLFPSPSVSLSVRFQVGPSVCLSVSPSVCLWRPTRAQARPNCWWLREPVVPVEPPMGSACAARRESSGASCACQSGRVALRTSERSARLLELSFPSNELL